MKLRYSGIDHRDYLIKLAFMLFGFSIVLDFSSTVLALSTETQFVELNPLIKGTGSDQIYSLIRLTLITAVIAFVLSTILVRYRQQIGNHRVLSWIANVLTKTVLITAFAKVWFSVENMLLYYLGTNFSYSFQIWLENRGLVSISSKKSALAFNTSIAMGVALCLYIVMMKGLEKREQCKAEKPLRPELRNRHMVGQ